MKFKQKFIATILVVMMLMGHISILENAVIAAGIDLTNQNSKTNHVNVEFDAYFEGETHSKTFKVDSEAKLYINIKVKNNGYLKNGIVKFVDSNFEIDSNNLKNDKVQSSIQDEIKLKQVNNSSEAAVIEVPIKILQGETVNKDLFNKISKLQFTGTYIDENGQEKLINKEVNNQVKWEGTAELQLAGEVSKYKTYSTEKEKGVIIQARVRTNLKDNSLPTVKTKLEIDIPEINEIKPERVTVVSNSTKATNGKDANEFTEQNYKYNSETGKIEIEVINQEQNGKISWMKNVADEYVISYIYTGEEIYNYIQDLLKNAKDTDTEKGTPITGSIQVKLQLEAYNGKETKLEKTGKIEYSLKEEKGDFIDTSINSTEKVSKGYIYANYAKTEKQENGQEIEPKKDTEYSVTYTAQVIDKELVDSLEFTVEPEKYLDENEEEFNSKTYTKIVRISEALFNKMLGEEGKLEIVNKQAEKLADITKNTEKDNAGYYIVNISEAKTNEIIIKTSKPVAEGNLQIILEKAISAEQNYTKSEMESFEKLISEVSVKAYTIEKVVENVNKKSETILTEPVSKAEISVNVETLSTVTENKDVEIRVVLDTLNTENALYKNPVLQVVMPENIEALKLNSVNLLLDDELKIAKKEVIEVEGRKAIQITLEGTQTKYLQVDTSKEQKNVIAKGANIVIKADVTFKKFAPSKKSNVLLYYTNENTNLFENYKQVNNTPTKKLKAVLRTSAQNTATGQALTGISIVSPNGVVTENHISGYKDNEKIENITIEKQEATIDTYASKKELTTGGTIINNYENVIENVAILGRVPSEGNKQIDSTEDLGSNFTIPMKEQILVSGIDSSRVKVFYSTNVAANRSLLDSTNGWTETPSNLADVRSYLINITGEIQSGTQLEFNYKAELPENLQFGKSSYTTYKVYYDNVTDAVTTGETQLAGTIGLTTGQGPDLSVTLSSDASTVREGQIVKMKATVKNNGTMTATNVKVNVEQLHEASFVQWLYGVGFEIENIESKTLEVGTLNGGESKEVVYYIRYADDALSYKEHEEDTITIEEGDENQVKSPIEVIQKVTITAAELKNAITSNEYTVTVEEGKISLSMSSNIDEGEIIQKGQMIENTIYVNNISEEEQLTNVVVSVVLPQGMKYKTAQIREMGERTGTTDGIIYTEATKTLTFNVGALEIRKDLFFEMEAEEFDGDISITAIAKGDNINEHYSNTIERTGEKVNLSKSELTTTPKYVNEGTSVTYTLTITNQGKSMAKNIQITDVLPEDLIFEQATYTVDGEEELITSSDENNVEVRINYLMPGKTATIVVKATAKLLSSGTSKEIKNYMTVKADSYNEVTTNTVTNIIEYYQTIRDQIAEVNPSGEDNPSTPSNPTTYYKVTGTAWIDENKDGKRDDTELPLSGIKAMLIAQQSSKVVNNEVTGEQQIVTTDENGKYEFNNVKSDEYLVVFLYDAGKYSITSYQKEGVAEDYNSDATTMKIVLDGEQCFAGVTDTIKITDTSARDIDIGLYESEKFDLRLDKYISKVTITTPSNGMKVYNYDNAKLIKREIYAKDVGNSTAIVEYKIVVTNEGQVAGYAKKIIDYLPENMKFTSDLNKDWYLSNSNSEAYNTSLENQLINPGESKEITLVLSMNITEKTIGAIINNNAEIYESYNEQGLQDMDSISANLLETEDDMSNADIIISIATGTIVLYLTLAFAVIVLLGIGTFEIKKRVLNKK